jgi:hypothetical protein
MVLFLKKNLQAVLKTFPGPRSLFFIKPCLLAASIVYTNNILG